MTNQKQNFLLNIAYYSLIFLLFLLILKFAKLLSPFIIGFIISILIYPAVSFLKEKFKIPPTVSAGILVTLILAAAVGIISMIILLLYKQAIGFTERIPGIIESFWQQVALIFEKNHLLLADDTISSLKTNLSSSLINLSVSFVGKVSNIFSSLPSFFIFLAAAIISCVLFCSDMPRVRAFLRGFLSKRFRRISLEIKSFITVTLARMIRAYIIIMAITFAELSCGFLIIGIKNALTTAALIAVIDILPVLGCGTVLIPWSLINAVSGNTPLALKLAVLYVIIACVRQFIEPRIVGSNIGLHPLVTLVSVYIGFKISGVLGMFVFPVLVITLIHLYNAGYLKSSDK